MKVAHIASRHPKPPRVLTPEANAQISATNHAERELKKLGLEIIGRGRVGQIPEISIRFQPGGMTRVLNQMTSRSTEFVGECTIVTGRYMGIILVWAVPK
jgi:hypothetical protein